MTQCILLLLATFILQCALMLEVSGQTKYENAAMQYLRQRQFDQAAQACAKALSYNPRSPIALQVRGSVDFERGEFEQAVKDMQLGLSNGQDYLQGEGYNILGRSYAELQDFQKSLAAFDAGIKRYPNYAHLHFRRGMLLGYQKDYKQALAEVDKAIAMGNQDCFWMRERRADLLRQAGQTVRWLKELDWLISKEPNIYKYRSDRAQAYKMLGKNGLADEEMIQANKLRSEGW
ncbi:MAG: tetratricopeptide repeat protein [Candidatus Melainabacteria bacterium]|nr:tetratricopeptide repeat protein [Candidatus Melainabacteria bacterium]